MSITTEITAMTWEENVELDSHEEVIRKGLETFQAVGAALVAIRDGRLYRNSHATFETYCQDRWSISRPQSYRLMAASEVAENLSPLGDTVPPLTNERQARALSKLEPEQQREAWVEAVATAPNGVVTAAHVQEVVDKKNPKKPKWIEEQEERQAKEQAELEELVYCLPDDENGLLREALKSVYKIHACVLGGLESDMVQAQKRYEAIIYKLNGETFQGCMAGSGGGCRAEFYCGSRPSIMPMWGQAGEFLAEVDGMRVVVKTRSQARVSSDIGLEFYAVDLDRPFISNTGYRHEPCKILFGKTYEQAAEAIIRSFKPVPIESGFIASKKRWDWVDSPSEITPDDQEFLDRLADMKATPEELLDEQLSLPLDDEEEPIEADPILDDDPEDRLEDLQDVQDAMCSLLEQWLKCHQGESVFSADQLAKQTETLLGELGYL